MRRWTRLILLSLVLGAVVNVLVAWWAAYGLPIVTQGHGEASGADAVLVCSGIGVTVHTGCSHPIWPGGDLSPEWQRGTMGWPLQSMSWTVRYRHDESLHESTYEGGLEVGEKLIYGNRRMRPAIEWRLPLRADPLSFVANSAFYGGLLVPVIGLAPFRRNLRAIRRSPRRAIVRACALAACMGLVVVLVSWTTVLVGKRSITSWTVGSTEWPGPFPSRAAEPAGVNVYTSWTRVDRDW